MDNNGTSYVEVVERKIIKWDTIEEAKCMRKREFQSD
jgi:hypothetical protein